ncbi:MAG: TonB-dependent receptor plug domain-containing protein [Gammaproteobacteria bacterium]|nr:TonB-dependent receptor plug domain-containing protein [Gammaproteobacteria bacterium]
MNLSKHGLSISVGVLAGVITGSLSHSADAQSTGEPGANEDEQSSRATRTQDLRLRPIRIEGAAESAFGPDFGYAVGRSTSGTKTDTPLLETPQSISVITRDRIEAQNADDLGEVLRYTPGIQGEPFGFETRLTFLRIRGFDATTTGLYRDNLQLRNPNFVVGYNLEPYGAERIEVPRGPASVLYGASNARWFGQLHLQAADGRTFPGSWTRGRQLRSDRREVRRERTTR